jgi:hypothetical protein
MAKFLSYRPFQQQVEHGIVHRNLQSSNISATPVRPRPSLDFARGRANVQVGGVCRRSLKQVSDRQNPGNEEGI